MINSQYLYDKNMVVEKPKPQVAFRRQEFGAGQKVVFFYVGWRGTLRHYRFPIQRLVAAGFRVLAYEYDTEAMSPDIELTKAYVNRICQDSLEQIAACQRRGLKPFATFGTSYGTLIAPRVAKDSPAIKKVILNTTGTWLGDTVWTWDHAVPGFKEAIVAQGISQPELHDAWREISIMYEVEKLRGKEVLLFASQRDELIPYSQTLELAKILRAQGSLKTFYSSTYLTHAGVIIKNLLLWRRYVRFLTAK